MIASPELSDGDFSLLGSVKEIHGSDQDYISVIDWNCTDKTGFKQLMETLLKKAEADPEKNENALLKNNIESLKWYLRLMATEHDLDQELKKFVINKIRHTMGAEFVADLTDEHFMYLSGVDPNTLPQL